MTRERKSEELELLVDGERLSAEELAAIVAEVMADEVGKVVAAEINRLKGRVD